MTQGKCYHLTQSLPLLYIQTLSCYLYRTTYINYRHANNWKKKKKKIMTKRTIEKKKIAV